MWPANGGPIIIPLLLAGLLNGCHSSDTEISAQPAHRNAERVYYKAEDDLYDQATLYVWNDDHCHAYAAGNPDAADWTKGLSPDGVDARYGAYWDLDVTDDQTQCINFIPRIGGEKPLGDFNATLDFTQTDTNHAVYTRQGVAAVYPELIPQGAVPENTARIYVNSSDNDINSFTLHLWNDTNCTSFNGSDTTWPGITPTGYSETYGAYWDIPVRSTRAPTPMRTEEISPCIHLIANNKTSGDYQTADLKFEFDKTTAIGLIGFIFKGTDTVYYQALSHHPDGQVQLSGASAIFADAQTLLVNRPDATKVTLYYSEDGALSYDSQTKTVSGASGKIASTRHSDTGWQTTKPHLRENFTGFSFDFSAHGLSLKDLLKDQFIVTASDASGVILATAVQPAGALDALYAKAATQLEYGAIINDDGSTTFRLWAPTAQDVKLIPYTAGKQAQAAIQMDFDRTSGSWVAEQTALTAGDFYRYQVTVYHPATQQIHTDEVSDPYALSLSMNSQYSQVVDLSDPALKPAGWDALTAPHAQNNPARMVIYEAHVRDFSATDTSTIPAYRGKYLAFTQADSVPAEHLKALSAAGVTHLHLLPVFDIATINEDPSQIATIDTRFSFLCQLDGTIQNDPDFGHYCTSDETLASVFQALAETDHKDNAVVQRLNSHVRNIDAFNWGYDPFHYTVPEGSYATDAEGMARIKEFRDMVMAIKQDIGMNVIMDVVYNHTNASGIADTSVLDRIVPWYYQRLNEITGAVEQSTCCSNTAPENKMFGKLIDDSISVWVKQYKIDAFRWDLMGHHPLAQIQQTLAAARKINPQVYFYGEGWNFGEVADDQMFQQATQANLGGTGIGSFSDRLRDAVRGGGPFDSDQDLRLNQGFGNGVYVQVNDLNTQTPALKATALHLADLVRLGMAGNLKDYQFTDSTGKAVKGAEVDYNGQPAGYAQDAWEVQNYVSKHDNQTLWDNNQYKIAYDVSTATRTRMQAVSLATAILGQGIPFIHMGSELLRSKSMQRDSYDSGDWFNKVDFTKNDNNWNTGLPREDKDGSNWSMIEQILHNAGDNAQPSPDNIAAMDRYFRELVALRASSGLFSLGKGSEIKRRVRFCNTGPDQIPGLIVMAIDNSGNLHDNSIDPDRDGLVVVINASPSAVSDYAGFDATGYTLHTISQLAGSDSIAVHGQTTASVEENQLSVPAWSVAVFEQQHQDLL
ncbi:pullulanase-type alpha-1,6-glucosidase [Vibrio aerogenes]|uniref:pullulanase-type alpha-1,6-glucosidase n=1 Tax=Vibrio aerogenes TaxID=92172 RepID=UPI001FE739A6|nr:pullulanase-type alpha-1,6-glucosidase [Vibrio aerogenes]